VVFRDDDPFREAPGGSIAGSSALMDIAENDALEDVIIEDLSPEFISLAE